MDAKIKELLTRLSFFAEAGMADKPIVEIAKQADAMLLEEARKPNTQQPVAWRKKSGSMWLFFADADNANAAGDEADPLYTATPVPRDVLMAFGEAIQKDCLAQLVKAVSTEHAQLLVEGVDLAAIADRYASKVQPEPVNQQLLAALNNAADALERAEFFEQATAARAASAAAKAAQPVVLADERVEFEKWFRLEVGMPDFVGFDQTAPWAEFAFKAWSARAAQQPASAQPVTVPDEMKIIGLHPTEYSLGYEYGWNACRAAMLSASQKTEV